ncbi:MAG: hypothetical protein C0514_03790 [Candidatus Puniceispirillum sp.]|nr:hypothetical protein [Candidatus Puniceispirillum sp.]
MNVLLTLFSVTLFMAGGSCFASASAHDVSAYFKEGREIFAKHLAHTRDATLDFFWTTGVSLSDDPTFFPPKHIHVGGTLEYGAKFFPYARGLLENTPGHLRVRFVCDVPTYQANYGPIEDLCASFGARFAPTPIKSVVARLHSAFPGKKDVIDAVFNNASRGNPAIASDIYRLIGMYFGHAQADLRDPVQRTYCDVDTFIYGMEHSDYPQLIEALFGRSSLAEVWATHDQIAERKKNAASFMVWRSRNINNLIKMRIGHGDTHRAWCEGDVLERIDPRAPWLSGRTKLHDAIRAFEGVGVGDQSARFMESLTHDQATSGDVISGTGPAFTNGSPYMVMNLTYPDTCTWTWHEVHYLKKSSPLGFLRDESLKESVEGFAFRQACDTFVSALSCALFAKRFGGNHPYYAEALSYLEMNHPYVVHKETLRDLVWADFERANTSKTRDAWQVAVYNDMTQPPFTGFSRFYPYFLHLKEALSKAGLPWEGSLRLCDLAHPSACVDDGSWDTEEDL